MQNSPESPRNDSTAAVRTASAETGFADDPANSAAASTRASASGAGFKTDARPPSFDRAAALARVGGDEDLLRDIAKLFLEDYPRSLNELREAAAHGDARAVEHAAHGLKGAVANFGAEPAVHAALVLEQMGRSGNLDGFSEQLNRLEAALAQLRVELQAL